MVEMGWGQGSVTVLASARGSVTAKDSLLPLAMVRGSSQPFRRMGLGCRRPKAEAVLRR
jgi:hypothetical protein